MLPLSTGEGTAPVQLAGAHRGAAHKQGDRVLTEGVTKHTVQGQLRTAG